MFFSSFYPSSRKAQAPALAVAAAAAGLLALFPVRASANEIGVQFVGSPTTPQPLAPGTSAGAPGVAQTHWNAVTGSSFTNVALNDNTGASTTALLNGSANGTYYGGNVSDTPGDTELTSGELFNGWTGSPTMTVSNIPYAEYDVYVYAALDNNTRIETLELTPSGGSASYQSFGTSTGGSTWVLSNNPVAGWNGTTPTTQPTRPASATYAEFAGITANSFTLAWGAPGNGGLNGIQIVESSAPIPEPATLGLMAVAGAGILLLKRRQPKQA